MQESDASRLTVSSRVRSVQHVNTGSVWTVHLINVRQLVLFTPDLRSSHWQVPCYRHCKWSQCAFSFSSCSCIFVQAMGQKRKYLSVFQFVQTWVCLQFSCGVEKLLIGPPCAPSEASYATHGSTPTAKSCRSNWVEHVTMQCTAIISPRSILWVPNRVCVCMHFETGNKTKETHRLWYGTALLLMNKPKKQCPTSILVTKGTYFLRQLLNAHSVTQYLQLDEQLCNTFTSWTCLSWIESSFWTATASFSRSWSFAYQYQQLQTITRHCQAGKGNCEPLCSLYLECSFCAFKDSCSSRAFCRSRSTWSCICRS